MSNSTRYFQITNDILLEYNYTSSGVVLKDAEEGDVTEKVIDLKGSDVITVIGNEIDNSTYFYVNDSNKSNGIYADRKNFVIPINKSHTKFIKYNRYDSYNDEYIKYNNDSLKLKPYMYDDELYDNGIISSPRKLDGTQLESNYSNFDIVFDKLRLHFTSRNFMGDYDSIIIQAYIYNYINKKINLLSFRINRFDNLTLNPEPMLLNQKLYTTYIDAKIVSTECLLNNKIGDSKKLLKYLISSEERLLKNTPIIFDLYGVKNTYELISFDAFTTEKITSVIVPCIDSYDDVYVNIEEADDGDYFKIAPKLGESIPYKYFSEFIDSLSEHTEAYMILHELSLTEYYIDSENRIKSEVTHREHYMLNAMKTDDNNYDDNNETLYILNSDSLNDDFLYRPICKHGSKCVKFTISDILKIVDTYDNTTIVKKGTYDCDKPYKYGKHMNKIYLGEVPAQINVYNKRSNLRDEDIDTVVFSTNPNIIKTSLEDSGVTIQSKEISIKAFCESTNIRIITTDILN